MKALKPRVQALMYGHLPPIRIRSGRVWNEVRLQGQLSDNWGVCNGHSHKAVWDIKAPHLAAPRSHRDVF